MNVVQIVSKESGGCIMRAFTCRVYLTDGTGSDQHQIELPDEPSFEDVRPAIERFLGNVPMEHIKLKVDGQPRDMFVDPLAEMKDLPINNMATAFYRADFMTKHPETSEDSLPRVHGVAVIFDQLLWERDDD